jgi:glycosyltransferase involved in cell wall biosynthesis
LAIVLEHRLSPGEYSEIVSDLERINRPYHLLARHFSTVRLLARVTVDRHAPDHTQAESALEGALPDFRGMRGLMLRFLAVYQASRQALAGAELVVVPVPAFAALPAWVAARLGRIPYLAHVVGDPSAVPGAIGMPVAGVWAALLRAIARAQVRNATAVWFVTDKTLQSGFNPHDLSLAASNVAIDNTWYRRPESRETKAPCKLLFVGSLAQPYKGLDHLLEALAMLGGPGKSWELGVVGDGGYRESWQRLAAERGIGSAVTWHGAVPRSRVRELMHDAHVFVMPSLTEGMPRALIEAMASGLACIGSDTGGIPELLEAKALVKPGDAVQLSVAVRRLVVHEEDRLASATACYHRSRDFASDHLEARIEAFLLTVVEKIRGGR